MFWKKYSPKNIDRIVVKTGYSSGHYSSFSAGKALDGNPNTFWHSPKPAGKLGWIAGQLQAPTKATHISLTIRKDMVAQAPLAFALSGSMDGINWKTIGIASQLQWVPEESKTFKINNSKKAYSYYKIIFLSTPDNAFVSIVEAGLWSSLPIGR